MLESVSEWELLTALRLYDRLPNVKETIDAVHRGASVDRAMLTLLKHLLAERSREAEVRRGEDRTYLNRRAPWVPERIEASELPPDTVRLSNGAPVIVRIVREDKDEEDKKG